ERGQTLRPRSERPAASPAAFSGRTPTMSRAYRIKVRESLKKILRASDRVSTQLEILEILPPEQMAELLANELIGRGFEGEGKALGRKENGVTVSVEPESGTVTVRAEGSRKMEAETEAEEWVGDVKTGKDALKKRLQGHLEAEAKEKEGELQKEVTDRLEG